MEPQQIFVRDALEVGEAARDLAAHIARPHRFRSGPVEPDPAARRPGCNNRGSSSLAAGRRPMVRDHNGDRWQSDARGPAESCNRPPLRASPSSSDDRLRPARGSLLQVMRVHSSAISRRQSRFQARRPNAYQFAWSKWLPVQLRSLPTFDTPAIACDGRATGRPQRGEQVSASSASDHIGARKTMPCSGRDIRG